MAKALAVILKILDLAQRGGAGPSRTLQMAFLGADVVKIKPHGTGEVGRIFVISGETSLLDSNKSN